MSTGSYAKIVFGGQVASTSTSTSNSNSASVCVTSAAEKPSTGVVSELAELYGVSVADTQAKPLPQATLTQTTSSNNTANNVTVTFHKI